MTRAKQDEKLSNEEVVSTSRSVVWESHVRRAETATEYLERVVSEIALGSAEDAQVLLALGTAGRLHVQDMALPAELGNDLGAAQAVAPIVARASFAPLEAAGLEILAQAPELGFESEEDGPLRERIRSALDTRTAIELVLQGVRAVSGREPGVTAEQWEYLSAFEQLIRPELFRLVPLGDMRHEAVSWIAPRHRPTFWWWSTGLDVPLDALDDLSGAAHLIARFPEVRAELERLIATQAFLDEGARLPLATAKTIEAGGRIVEQVLRSIDEGASLLLERPEFRVTASASELIVEIDTEPASGSQPELEVGGNVRLGQHAGARRHRFPLTASERDSQRVVLHVPLDSGRVSVVLADEKVEA